MQMLNGLSPFTDDDARQIWAGVMWQAIDDHQKLSAYSPPISAPEPIHSRGMDARAWFNSARFAPGSFRWICEALGAEWSAVLARIESGAVKELAGRSIASVAPEREADEEEERGEQMSLPTLDWAPPEDGDAA